MKSRRRKTSYRSIQGFGFLELLIVISVFSIAMVSIMNLNLQSHQVGMSETEVAKVRAMRQMLISLIMDGGAWLRTTQWNGAPVAYNGWPAINTAVTPYFVPPHIPPNPAAPYTDASGTPFHIFAADGTVIVNATAGLGFTKQGVVCAGFSATASTPDCPMRWEPRWLVATNASNPIVYVTLNLQVSPNTILLKPTEHSATFSNNLFLTRQLFMAWSNLGPTTAGRFGRSSFAYVQTCNFLPCGALGGSFTNPGAFCGAFVGTYLLCTGACSGYNGTQQVYRCQ